MDLVLAITDRKFPIMDFRPLISYFLIMDYNFTKSMMYTFDNGATHLVNFVLGIENRNSRTIVGCACWTDNGIAQSFSFEISRIPRRIRIDIFNSTLPLLNGEEITRDMIKKQYKNIHNKLVDKTLKDIPPLQNRPHPLLFAINRTRNNHHQGHFNTAIANHIFTQSFVDICSLLKVQYS